MGKVLSRYKQIKRFPDFDGVTFDENDNVGIGTDTPLAKLHIVGTTKIQAPTGFGSNKLFSIVAPEEAYPDKFEFYSYGGFKVWDFICIWPKSGIAGTGVDDGAGNTMFAACSDLGADGTIAKWFSNTTTGAFLRLYNWDANFHVTTSAITQQFAITNDMLVFGPEAGTAPGLKADGTALSVRLDDDSAYAPLNTGPVVVDGGGRFDLAANEYVRFKGVDNFLLTIGDSGGIPALMTNGYITINGNSIGDPHNHTIAGHNTYMFGIWTDIASEPIMVVKGSTGDFQRFYNGSDNLVFNIDQYGGAQFGADNMSVVNFGKNIASTSELKVTNGRLESRYGGETFPRYLLHNNGHLTFSLDGTVDPVANGCRLSIPATGSMAFYTSNFSAFVEAMRIDSSQRVGIGTDNPAQKLDVSGNARVVGDFYLKGLKFEESVDKPALLIGSYRDVRLGNTAGEGVYNLVAIGKNMFGNGVAGVDRITDSVALGTDCCTHMKHGNGNAAFGNLTLYEIVDSNSNTAIGDSALRNTIHTTGSTGWQNTATGYICGQGNTTGMWNVFMGSYAASAGSGTANYTVLLGGYAGAQDDTVHAADSVGDYTIGIGYMAARYAKGVNLVAIGFESLIDGLGDNLTAVGHRAGAGVSDASASTSTFIGSQAGASGSQKIDCVNSTAIGYNAYTTRDNEVVLGNASVLHTVLRGDVTGIGMISLTQDYGGTAPSNGLWRGSGYTFLTVGASGLQINNTDNSLGLFNLLPTGQINMRPPASATPDFNGQVTFELTSNTSLTIKAKGSDGTVRSTVLTLSP